MFEPMELTNDTVIKVIGVGGGNGNIIEYMVHKRTESIRLFAMNTGARALRKTAIDQTTQIGNGITEGLGAGANPEIDRNVTDEDREALRAALDGVDTVFIAAGMGDGAGTNTTSVVTGVAEDLGILTVAMVTKPSSFESKRRIAFARQGIAELSKHVGSLVTTPSDELPKVPGRGTSPLDTFDAANDILKGAVQDITGLITRPDLMDVDFIDIRTAIPEMGYAMMGSDVTSGEDRTEETAEMAISSPLLEDISLSDTHGVLVSITAGFGLRLDEFETVNNTTRAFTLDNTAVVIGTSLDPDTNSELRVTAVATGIGMDEHPETALMTNKQARQSVIDHCRQHDMSPLVRRQKPAAKMVNNSAPQTAGESDYLDIPAFLHKQAD